MYCWHILELHWKMEWYSWPFLGILAFALALAQISHGLQCFTWVLCGKLPVGDEWVAKEWTTILIILQKSCRCENLCFFLSHRFLNVPISAFMYQSFKCTSLLNVPVMLLSSHIFSILTRGQVFFFLWKGIAVLSCFTEVSQGQRLEKLSLVGMECCLFPGTTNDSGLGWGCCSASQNPGLYSWASAFCSASAVEVGRVMSGKSSSSSV